MKRFIIPKENIKDRVFPIRISLKEETLLRKESKETKKSIATLIREGRLSDINEFFV
jgi:hypothetical protein